MSEVSDRERWNQRYSQKNSVGKPSDFVSKVIEILKDEPRLRVADLAGGAGRNALGFAEKGFPVSLFDVSDIALRLANEHFEKSGLSLDGSYLRNLEIEGIPEQDFSIYFVFHYLNREIFAQVREQAKSGSFLCYCQPTELNLEKHPRPSKRFLLKPGEMSDLSKGFEKLYFSEDWFETRHEARAILRVV